MTDFNPVAGKPYGLRDDLSLILAPNPSPMTYLGTNTYVVGRDTVAVIDPGPDNADHLAALESVIAGRSVSHILVTHSHLDHSPLAAALSAKTNAPICAFGDSTAGRSAVMRDLAKAGLAGGGEGIDHHFSPDQLLQDGADIVGPWGTMTALHTPGHLGNHLCFVWGSAVFTGDHVMGWASSLVSPPDGDLTDFMVSCSKLQMLEAKIYYPGHGAPVLDPKSRIDWLISHRRQREKQILAALSKGPMQPAQLTKLLYADVAPALHGAAERNVFAHLIDLYQRQIVVAKPSLGTTAIFDLS